MADHVWIHATGTFVRDAGKAMFERGLALSVDVFESFPMRLKDGKAKLGSNTDSAVLLVERARLDEAMVALRHLGKGTVRACALPVLATIGIG